MSFDALSSKSIKELNELVGEMNKELLKCRLMSATSTPCHGKIKISKQIIARAKTLINMKRNEVLNAK